jgi:amino acid transporter
MWVFLTASHADFVSTFNNLMLEQANLENAYSSVIEQARSLGLQTDQPTDFHSALLALPVGYWAFIGFTYSAYVGGEIKKAERSQTIGILGALAFGYVVYMVTMGAYYNVVGRDFNNAVALLQTLEKSPLPTSGSMSFFAGIITKSAAANLLISVSTFLWFFMMLFVMATVCVRNIFAWSFDRIAPATLAQVTERRGAPWVATLVVVGCAECFLAAQAFVGITFMNYIALFSVCFLVAGIAAIVFPYRRKELFEQAPPIVRHRIFGLPLITVAGLGNTVLFLLVLYSALTNAGLSGVTGKWFPIAVLVGIYGAGFLVYAIVKAYRSSHGIDLRLLYSEIPPE